MTLLNESDYLDSSNENSPPGLVQQINPSNMQDNSTEIPISRPTQLENLTNQVPIVVIHVTLHGQVKTLTIYMENNKPNTKKAL